MRFLMAFISAFLFGLGLGFSGMTDPHNVKGFLDLFGDWKPALIFVMGGAILFHSISYFLITKRKSPLLTPKFLVPNKRNIDAKLITGSALFGIGWGLAGYCPGPAIASVFTLNSSVLLFIGSMLIGIVLYHSFFKRFFLG